MNIYTVTGPAFKWCIADGNGNDYTREDEMRHGKYLRYVLRHKWFVFVELFKVWLANPTEIVLLWRGITHDLSKFRPSEWGPYADYFYGGKYLDTYTKDWVKRGFDAAWNRHQKRNTHHWQYWVLLEDDGGTKLLAMPVVDIIEMVCDWKGAGRALGNPDTAAWYRKNYWNIQLHEATRNLVDYRIGVFDAATDTGGKREQA